jgi:hypothetical protein
MAELGTALHDAGAISFGDYAKFVTKPLLGDPAATAQLWNKPSNTIQQLQGTINWQEQQKDPLSKLGLTENKSLLNVLVNLNSLNIHGKMAI